MQSLLISVQHPQNYSSEQMHERQVLVVSILEHSCMFALLFVSPCVLTLFHTLFASPSLSSLCSALAASYLCSHNGQVDADAGWEVDVRTEHSQNQFLSSSPAAPLTWALISKLFPISTTRPHTRSTGSF